MVPDVQRWLDFAENDLAVAKHLWETFHPKPLESSAITASKPLKKQSKPSILHLASLAVFRKSTILRSCLSK